MRSAVGAIAVLFLSASVCLAEDSYLPAGEKATWVYERNTKTDVAGVGVVTASGTVTGTCKVKEKVGDESCWVIEWTESDTDDQGESRYACKMWVRAGGESVVVVKTTSDSVWLLPADMKDRKARVKVQAKGSEVTCESTVGDEEDVKTPAGKFHAVKVTNEVSTAGTKVKTTAWYAKQVGLVRLHRLIETAGSKVTDELSLKKFTKGQTEADKKPDDSKKPDEKTGPVADEKDLLLPAKEGAAWTYQHQSTTEVAGMVKVKEKETVTCTVKGKEKIGDAELWLLEWDGGSESKFNAKVWVRADSGGVTIGKTSGRDLWMIPADVKAKKAKVKVHAAKEDISVESSVGEEEEVTVPAGTFKAVRVTGEVVVAAGADVKRTVWYAKGVGIVKVSKDVDTAGVSVRDELVLKKIGKE